jgi:SAM-dependent methyltransferase
MLLRDTGLGSHDELDHLVGHRDGHNRAQADFFDRAAAAEFEIERPHGTPRLYQWLLERKLKRGVRGIESLLPGATVLVVCGGSGMDAEFYARRGARVISADISIGAAKRVAQRAKRFQLDITPIVADAEHLPFETRSVDVVSVHDGLHHLVRPMAALGDMCRVAGRAVSVTEPAKAAVTALAVRLGLAMEREEAGNRVIRLRPRDLASVLRGCDFGVVSSGRYAMYYPHVPGRVMGILSHEPLLTTAKIVIAAVDMLIGRAGNKLSIVGVRRH